MSFKGYSNFLLSNVGDKDAYVDFWVEDPERKCLMVYGLAMHS